MRLLRLVALLSILNRTGAHTLRGRVTTYVFGGAALLVVTAALAVTDAERGRPGATIANLGDGFWWATTTLTTVGYGDLYPVTTEGRVIAVALMIGGVTLLGAVAATLASWLVERVAAEAQDDEAATRAPVDTLVTEIRALRCHRSTGRRGAGPPDPRRPPPRPTSAAARRPGGVSPAGVMCRCGSGSRECGVYAPAGSRHGM